MALLYNINPGVLEVYYGPMNSGKGESLIGRISSINYVPDSRYEAFKPLGDTRTPGIIYSRVGGGISIPAIEISEDEPWELFKYINNSVKVVVIDEVQLFDNKLVPVVNKLLDDKINVILSGLNLDFRGEPFGIIPYFIIRADVVTPLYAVCEYMEKNDSGETIYRCGMRATRTQRLVNGLPAPYNDIIKKIGDKEGVNDKSLSYQARCREHHIVPGSPKIILPNYL
ncbi:MAG: thymidine kinase [Candidatus Woesearchaeota archaeon]